MMLQCFFVQPISKCATIIVSLFIYLFVCFVNRCGFQRSDSVLRLLFSLLVNPYDPDTETPLDLASLLHPNYSLHSQEVFLPLRTGQSSGTILRFG